MKEINISKNIADLRKRKGITQEQLASALNISPQAISKWETNTSFPDTQTLPLIAAYFEVSVDYIFSTVRTIPIMTSIIRFLIK